MADPINQQYNIDASQAFTSLDRLDSAFRNLEGRLSRTANEIREFNQITGQNRQNTQALARNVGTLARNLERLDARNPGQNLARGFDAAEDQARQAAREVERLNRIVSNTNQRSQSLTISWQTLGRVLATQAIVRSINAIGAATEDAVQSAIELQRQFSLITTIQPNTGVGEIGDAVRSISDNLNIPQLEVASGLYDAISNQVSQLFGETVRFTEAAGQFARATGSDLSSAVDLLSGAIRSYGLSVDDVERVQGVFFSAIDKGRVTAEELANAFGRVGPAANSLGLELEDVAGTIATISDRGLSTAETLTALRGILNAVTKPTEDLQRLFRQLGFDSGETAIQTLGFTDTLRALVDATGGSQSALAELFPRVRGLTGVLALASDNFETLEANIRDAQEAGEDFAGEQFLRATANDAELVTKAAERIRNEFIDLGQSIVGVGADAIRSLGGLENATDLVGDAFETLSDLIVTLAGGALVLGIAAATLALGPLGAAAVAAGAGFVAAQVASTNFRREVIQDINRVSDSVREASEGDLQQRRETDKEVLDSFRERNDELVAQASRTVQAQAGALNQELSLIQTFNEVIVQDTNDALQAVVDARKAIVDELTAAVTEADDRIAESQERILELNRRLADRGFERDLEGQTEAEQVFALTARAQEQAAEARRLFAQGVRTGNEELIEQARDLFENAEELSNRAARIGRQSGDARLQNRGEQVGDEVIRQQIRLEEQRQTSVRNQRQEAESILSAEETRLRLIEATAEAAQRYTDLLTTGGSAEAIQAQSESLSGLLEQLNTLAGDTTLLDGLDLRIGDDARADLEQALTDVDAKVRFGRQQVAAAIDEAAADITVSIPFVGDLSEALDRDVAIESVFGGDLGAVARGLGEARDTANQLAQEFNNTNEQARIFARTIGEAQRLAESVGEDLPQNIQLAARTLANIVADGSIDDEEIRRARTVLEELQATAGRSTPESEAALVRLTQAAELISSARQQVADLENSGFEVFSESDRESLNTFSGLLQGTQSQIADPLTQSANAINTAAGNLETAADNAAQKLLISANTIGGVGGESGLEQNPDFQRSQGGVIPYYQDGGTVRSRGTDTMLAGVSPGERIIDARNASRFFPQLSAIGAGRAPATSPSGGDVTTVGDINITVAGGNPSAQTVEEIGRLLDRRIRRGQLRFKR